MATPKDVEKYHGLFWQLYRELKALGGDTKEIKFDYVKHAQGFRQQCYGFGKALERKWAGMSLVERENDILGIADLLNTHKSYKIKLEGSTLRFVEAATESNPMYAAVEAALDDSLMMGERKEMSNDELFGANVTDIDELTNLLTGESK